MKIYGHPLSPPSLFLYGLADYLGLTYEIQTLDLVAGEHRNEEFGRLNPNQFVPTLVDGDFTLYESLAIARYFAAIAKKEQTVYPNNDAKARALIDQALGTFNDFRYSEL